jgi:DNA recombination protein RmuC
MPLALQLGLAFGIGGLLGLLLGWLLFRGRSAAVPAPPDARLEEELRRQNAEKEILLTQLRAQLAETGNARAAAEARQSAAEQLLAEQKQIHERNLTEARRVQDKALTDLREAFKALSAEALKQTAPEFLRLAEQSFGKFQETAKGDLAQRQEANKPLVQPFTQQL